MGKRRKDSSRHQSTSCAQDVVKPHDTSPSKVCSGKETEKNNTETSIYCGTSTISLLSDTEMSLPNLTSMTPQKLNDPLHIDPKKSHDLLNINKKHLPTSSTKDKCPIKQNEKKHKNSEQVSSRTEVNIELTQEKSSPSTSKTRITETSSISAEAAPTIIAVQHIILQQNVNATSTNKATIRHLDSYDMSKNRMSQDNIKPRVIISQPTEFNKPTNLKSTQCEESRTNLDFLQPQDITMPSQSTLSNEKNSVFDLGKKPKFLLVSTPPLSDTPNSAQTAASTNQQNNKKQHAAKNVLTKTQIITERMLATKVPQYIPELLITENTATQNNDNKQSTTELNNISHVSKCLTACTSTLSPLEYKSNTARAETEIPQLEANMKMDPTPLTKMWSTLQISELSNAIIHHNSTAPVTSAVNVPIKSELFQNEGVHVALTATTEEAGNRTNTPTTPIWSKYPTQKTKSYVSQDNEVAQLCKEVTECSETTKAAAGNGSAEDAIFSTDVSQSTQKSQHTSSLVYQAEEVDKTVPLLPSTTKTVQGSTGTEDMYGDTISESTFLSLGHSVQNSTGSPSRVVTIVGLHKEPVNSLTVRSGASTKDDDVRTSTTQSTQNVLSNAANNGDKFSKSGTEAAIISLTINNEAEKIPAASSMSGNEAPSVVADKNTNEKTQVCVQARNKEMPSKTTKVKTAQQHTSLDTPVTNIYLPAVSKPLESSILPNIREQSESPDILIKLEATQKKCSTSTKLRGRLDTNVVEKFADKTGIKCGVSTHKTQQTFETDSKALKILRDIPVKTPKPLRYNTNTFCTDDSADTKDIQILDKRLDTQKNDESMKNLTIAGKNSGTNTAKTNDKTVDSKEKQENKGQHTSHISIRNQFPGKEQCKVYVHENKTDTGNSQTKETGVINYTDTKLKLVKGDGETNKIFTSKESYNKVCKNKTKSAVTNKDTKTQIKSETSEKSKHNIHAQSTIHDFKSNQTNQDISVSCNKNAKRQQNKNTQNSTTELLVNATNREAINNMAQQKKKKCTKNRGKNTANEVNTRDLRQEEYEASKNCSCKEEKTEFQMDPETMKIRNKQSEALKSDYSSETKLIKEEPSGSKPGDSTQANNKVPATLQKEHLPHASRTGLQLCVSYDNSGRLHNIMPSMVATNPTNTVSTTDDEAEMEHKLIQRHIFLTYVCHVCKSTASSSCSLKKCSNCKMISYCSKQHQREHWAAHKDLCKVISKICKQNRMTNLFGKAVGISPDEYRYYRSHCINKCEKELGRELYLWEKEMICYPQVCHTCYEFDTQKLSTCQKCHHVSYCRFNHLKTDHDMWCKEFQVYRDITLYQCHNGIIQPSLPDRSLQQYAPLTGDIKIFLSNINNVSEKSLLLQRLHLVALSDIATCPLTVLFSLQQCNFHPENVKTFTIHLVGAEMQFEADTLQKWEMFLLHLIPSLNTLKVVFIGPGLKTESEFNQSLGKTETCNKCTIAGRTIIYEFWRTLYHNFVTSLDYQKPHLICAFNSGLYRLTDFEGKDTWSPTIKAMLEEPDIPVVVTEYTEKELPFDMKRIQNIVDSLEIIMPPTRNPFASLKPSLNFLSEETVPVIFKNFYITILKGENMQK